MHPTQFSSFSVYMGNHPSLLGARRHANTSTGHTARQKPQALHMSSVTTTSQRPAGPREGFLSVLNSGIGHPRHDIAPGSGPGSVRVPGYSADGRRSFKHATPSPVNSHRHWCSPEPGGTIRSITCPHRQDPDIAGAFHQAPNSSGQGRPAPARRPRKSRRASMAPSTVDLLLPMFRDAVEMLSLTRASFRHFDPGQTDMAMVLARSIHKQERDLTEQLLADPPEFDGLRFVP